MAILSGFTLAHTAPLRLVTLGSPCPRPPILRAWFLAVAIGLSLSACMSRPFDGQRVPARTSRVEVAGYHASPSGRVNVLAMNTATGAFESVGTSTASAIRFTSLGGVDWYEWNTPVVLGDRFWTSGARGSYARIRAETADGGAPFSLYSLQEDWLDCAGRRVSERWTDIVRECSALNTPEATICTDDFVPSGRRRGPCPRRTLDVLGADGRIARRHPLPDQTTTVVDPPFPTRIAWRGDAMSFIDVFDVNLASREDVAWLGTHGMPYGNFIRLRYPNPTESREFRSFNVDSLASGLLPGAGWRGAVSFRQYDPGECSGFLTWREILDLLTAKLEDSLTNAFTNASGGHITARIASGISLTPILRSGAAGDAVRLGLAVHLTADGLEAGRAVIGVTIGFTATSGALTGTAEQVNVSLTDVALTVIARLFGAPDRATSELRIAAAIRTAVPSLVTSSLPPIFRGITFYRVYGRPDGIEAVVAESQDDPQFARAQGRGLCERANPDTSSPVAGHFDGLFSGL